MYLKFFFTLILALAFCSCQNNSFDSSEPADKATVLLNEANSKENTNDFGKQIKLLLQADTIAISEHRHQEHLECSRTIATLYLQQGNNILARKYFDETVKLAKKLSAKEDLAIALNNIGLILSDKSDYDSAINYFTESNLIFRSIGKQEESSQAMVNLANAYKNQGNFEIAYKVNLDAIKVLETLDNKKNVASCYSTMGNILKELNLLDDALQYHQKAMKIFNEYNDSVNIAGSFNNVGNIYRYKKKYTEALYNYFHSLTIKEKLGNVKSIATTLDNIAQSHLELNNIDTAETYFKKALDFRHTAGDNDGFITTSNRLSNLYLKKKEVIKAESVALKAYTVSPVHGLLKQRMENNLLLFEIYRILGQDKLASAYARKGIELKDSLFNAEMANTISLMHTKYKTEEKEKELILSKKLQKSQASKINLQQYFIILLVTFLLTLSYLVVQLYRSNKAKKQAKHKIETLMKELNHRVKNNLQIVSDMLHLQMETVTDQNQIDLLQGNINRIESMNIIHTLLYKENYSGQIDIRNFIETLVANIVHSYEDKSAIFKKSINIINLLLDIDKAIPIGLIVNELITNIFKYAAPYKDPLLLIIKLSEENNTCKLEIVDNAQQWNIYEIQKKDSGLGLFLVKNLVKQLDANWNITSNENGTKQIIEFSK